MVGTDPAPFGAGTSEPNVTLDTSHHAGGLRPIESMAAAQMQQLETNVVQRRPEQQPSAAAAANVFTTAQHASLSAGMPGSVSGPCTVRSPFVSEATSSRNTETGPEDGTQVRQQQQSAAAAQQTTPAPLSSFNRALADADTAQAATMTRNALMQPPAGSTAAAGAGARPRAARRPLPRPGCV